MINKDFYVVMDKLVEKNKVKRDLKVTKISKKRLTELKENNLTYNDVDRMLSYFKKQWENFENGKYYRVSTLFNGKFVQRIIEALDSPITIDMVETEDNDKLINYLTE